MGGAGAIQDGLSTLDHPGNTPNAPESFPSHLLQAEHFVREKVQYFLPHCMRRCVDEPLA